ncbi:membrane protein [Alsobacter metallidurans]|uniref:Membrane protein n=1 Tax=Alsobacter metallidurans TaxID=340221 RepID=A0A917I8W1_9HYPH|nr:efflux RND transporter periplasmic adaptor subunit [Alsobacter metallidurans]GGH24112.1 membrane protein [Alsobacter metallidurans]
MRMALAPVALSLALLTLAPAAQAGEFIVQRSTVQDMKAVFGQVQSRDTVSARARLGGVLISRTVEEGSAVKAGEVIATVGDEKLALQAQAIDARIKALEAQLANARSDLERSQALIARGVETQSRLDQLRTAANVLTNQIEAARADRAVIAQQTAEGQVLAPKDGRVLTVPAAPGGVVMPGETVARIAAGGYFLRVALPERHAARIKVGDVVSVGERGPGVPDQGLAWRQGRIVKVYPELDGGRVIADAEVEGLGDYFVGERVAVWIAVAERQAIIVPVAAVRSRAGIDYVRVMEGADALDVPVIIRPLADARVEILSGLRAGDKVLTP